MPDRMKINEAITIGAQPSEAELKAMAEDGVKAVINLRADGEDMQPMPPEAEGKKVQAFGMKYITLPVAIKEAGPDLVDRFRQALAETPKPVFVHCRLGKRAGAFVMMDQAVQQGWSGQQTLDMAEDMGFECDNEDMEQFVKDYIDSRAATT